MAYLDEGLVELAELIESGQKAEASNQGSQRPGELNPQERDAVAGLKEKTTDDQWITVTAAAKLLKKSLGTICRWVRDGKVRDNGKKRYQRRILKTDILLIKQDTEETDAKKDDDEVQRDEWRMNREL